MPLPHLSSERPYVADGGLETSLIFQAGIDLPDFAAFPLLDSDAGRAARLGSGVSPGRRNVAGDASGR